MSLVQSVAVVTQRQIDLTLRDGALTSGRFGQVGPSPLNPGARPTCNSAACTERTYTSGRAVLKVDRRADQANGRIVRGADQNGVLLIALRAGPHPVVMFTCEQLERIH